MICVSSRIQWGSEYRTRPIFEWLDRVCLSNCLVIKSHLKTGQKPFENRTKWLPICKKIQNLRNSQVLEVFNHLNTRQKKSSFGIFLVFESPEFGWLLYFQYLFYFNVS